MRVSELSIFYCPYYIIFYTYMTTLLYTYPLLTSYIPRFLQVFSYTIKHICKTNGIPEALKGGGWGFGRIKLNADMKKGSRVDLSIVS